MLCPCRIAVSRAQIPGRRLCIPRAAFAQMRLVCRPSKSGSWDTACPAGTPGRRHRTNTSQPQLLHADEEKGWTEAGNEGTQTRFKR